MGFMSRRVIPACGNLCFFCPSLRARSRQPVKRYKKLIAEIFPRSQDAVPNDRKIAKLCEYASKNPLRIPKITENLEQRCYKDLRTEHFGSVKVVVYIYMKLLSSSKEQLPLFASSLLCIVRTLLEQTRQDEMRILGCNLLVDFIKNQTDSTYMFNLEGVIPKLCQLAQEVGEDNRALSLRSAGLHVLAIMVWFMGEYSHLSMDFDTIIDVMLENYIDPKTKEYNRQSSLNSEPQGQWVQEVLKTDENGSSFPDINKKVSIPDLVNSNPKSDPAMDVSENPTYWSRVCLQNMAGLAKEATTVRRVLEPLFRSFDSADHWSPESGIAFSILSEIQLQLEKSGHKNHVLLSILVKHLDHKNVVNLRNMQVNIINITTQLAQQAKLHGSVAIVGAVSDLMKHLRKCMQCSVETSSNEDVSINSNTDLHSALEDCLAELSNKVGDVGPILDMMSMVLENIPTTAIVARATILSVYRTAQLISAVPNISYYKKAFPEALFHQLILAMVHPDPETRVGAHCIFSVVLLPSLDCFWSDPNRKTSVALSGFYSSAAASQKSRRSIFVHSGGECQTDVMDEGMNEERNQNMDMGVLNNTVCPSHSFKLSSPYVVADGKEEVISLRLSSQQVGLLLSSIWVQATLTENAPTNYEAMSHSYILVLLFSLTKNSSHVALVRCFQLAFSLRSISLDQEGGLQLSRRRSLFTLASAMLIFSAKAANLPELVPYVKASLTHETVDPFLELVDDMKLQAVYTLSNSEKTISCSKEDEVMASKSLSEVEADDEKLREIVSSHFLKKSKDEFSGIKEQLLEGFSPDDVYPLGAALFLETPRPCSPLAEMVFQAFNEIMPASTLTDDEAFNEDSGNQSDRTSLAINTLDILSVNQLLDSVLETARQVATYPLSTTPIPYDQMKNQCEALVMGKHQKMSTLLSLKNQQEAKGVIGFSRENEKKRLAFLTMKMEIVEKVRGQDQMSCSTEYEQSFRLPPSSPYDKFLKAAGC